MRETVRMRHIQEGERYPSDRRREIEYQEGGRERISNGGPNTKGIDFLDVFSESFRVQV